MGWKKRKYTSAAQALYHSEAQEYILDAVFARLEIVPHMVAQHLVHDGETDAKHTLPKQKGLHSALGVCSAVEFCFHVRAHSRLTSKLATRLNDIVLN